MTTIAGNFARDIDTWFFFQVLLINNLLGQHNEFLSIVNLANGLLIENRSFFNLELVVVQIVQESSKR